jgi:glutaredoxin
MLELTLYSRPGCHLCETVLEDLEPRCRAAGVVLTVADVDRHDEWRRMYGERIPVLVADGREIAAWPFDWAAVSNCLAQG